MLWDLIRDFFVIHVFGGVTSEMISYGGFMGSDTEGDYWYTNTLPVKLGQYGSNEFPNTFGDYLSTTATIISITIIVVLCCLFIYKIVRLIGGLIR